MLSQDQPPLADRLRQMYGDQIDKIAEDNDNLGSLVGYDRKPGPEPIMLVFDHGVAYLRFAKADAATNVLEVATVRSFERLDESC